MIATKSQASIDPTQIQPILERLGYKLTDFGNHWRTNAIFRKGTNTSAIGIYKNSGVWTDFSLGNQSFPFEKLIQLTIGEDRAKLHETLSSIKKSDEFVYVKKQTIEMEEIYPDSMLQKLFPNYNFYKKKNISEDTLKFYRTGLAGAGKMYRRMVFPIYNEHSQIIGFSGRKIDDSNELAPKWKHIGKKKNWIYPALIPNENSIDSIIKSKQEVILVESIGDSMALYEQGIKNTLVTFGIGCSPALLSYLASFPIKKITIAGNNDFRSAANHGYNGTIKILMSLRSYFDFDTLEIKLPPEPYNDFSEAHEAGYNLQDWHSSNLDRKQYLEDLKKYITKYMTFFKQKDVESLLKTISNHE